MHVNSILIKGEESALHNSIPDSHERVKTAPRDWWRGQQNRLPHRWEAWFSALRSSLAVGLTPGWLTASEVELQLDLFIYLYFFWGADLWFWVASGVVGCSSARGFHPGMKILAIPSWDGQMGYELTFKSFQPLCDASSKNFCHHAQCITLQLSVCPSPTAPGVRAATAAKPTCVHGSQSCLWDRCFPLCWSLWLEAEAPVVIKHRLHQPVGLLWI